jgi:cytoskeletal protein CcmA (bactofilin family)
MFSAKTSGKNGVFDAPRPEGKGGMPSIISQHLAVVGDMTSDGDIQVDGSVEGDIKTAILTIGETGIVKGTVDAETVRLAGSVVGQIRAKTVSLTRTARVEGDIWHDSISIEAGAHFVGASRQLSESFAAAVVPQDLVNWGKGKRQPDGKHDSKAEKLVVQGSAE